ncbi:hypothetical protein RJ639_019037 [Escallonia herrerae]|uniref:Uncharacterized protein n=1 Tax=Escallonia herrerae TaxID=1293975 RepID=A0AA88V8C6_9ASTE|nr:hypothetical protein RJ639_019037 [Escallonia herrerae]
MIGGGVSSVSRPSSSLYSHVPSKTKFGSLAIHPSLTSSSLKLRPTSTPTDSLPSISLRCNSSTGPGGPGDNDNKSVLDAFFLGKALAEALNERIESTVGEFLSTIGRLQVEQQKQVQDFQEEVLEKAKRAQEKAAREALEAQGLISKSSSANKTTVSNGVSSTTTASTADAAASSYSPPNSSVVIPDNNQNAANSDPLLGVPNED